MYEPLSSIDAQALNKRGFFGDGPKKLLVAVDRSSTSLRAMSYAAGLARRSHSVLLLVHVHSGRGPLGLAAVDVPDLVPNASGIVSFTQVSRAIACEYGIQVVLVLRDGDPVQEIARIANEIQADEVIVGCSGSSLHLFSESVPSRLVNAGRWPVTVVP